jgi:hypothetical protein
MNRFLFSIFLFAQALVYSQGTTSQAGIYRVRLYVDKELTNQFLVSNVNQSNIYSGFRFSTIQRDSIMALIQETVKRQLFKDATLIYDMKGDGTPRKTIETGTYAGGYPKMTKRRAIYSYEEEVYVKVRILVEAFKGPGIGVAGVQYSNIHPSVKLKIKAYDASRKKIYSRKIRLWDFDKISSLQFSNAITTVTQTNALTSEQIYQMIKHTIRVFNDEEERNR